MKKYDKIESLSEIEWIHLRPHTFIGSIENSTHLLVEVLDNSLDEVLNKYADEIQIIIDNKQQVYKVIDNGRGIPCEIDKETGVPYVVKACTKLFTSGKFNKKMKAYDQTIGLNGIGLVLVTALSEWVKIIVYRDNNEYIFNFKTDFEKHEIKYEYNKKKNVKKRGTIVEFKPSNKIFKKCDVDIDKIKQRLLIVKFLSMLQNQKIKLNIVIDNEQNEIMGDLKTIVQSLFKENCTEKDVIELKSVHNNEEMRLFLWNVTNKNDTKMKGVINYLPVHKGTHVEFIEKILKKILTDLVSDKYSGSIHLLGFRLLIVFFLNKKEFGNQIKDVVEIDPDYYKNFVNKSFKEQLKNQLLKIINIDEYLKRLKMYQNYEENGLLKEIKEAKKKSFIEHFYNCEAKKDIRLYIVEGDSAAGSVIKCRNRKNEAVFVLTGKSIPNVEKNTKKILKNKILLAFFNVLENTEKFKEIVIATDPDIDGYHITTLLLKMFRKYFPELIEQKKIALAKIPLYGYYKKDKFISVYQFTDDLKKEIEKSKINLTRYKGLGEFDLNEIKEILFDNLKIIKIIK